MNKKGKYALNGALMLGLGNALLNAINQLNQMDKEPSKTFDWGQLLGSAAKGAVVGAAGGFAVGAIADHQNSLEKPIDTDAFLFSVVNTVRLNKEHGSYKSLDEKADRLIELLKIELGDKLAGEPMRLGSTENGTALANNFDIDICLAFKPGSFSSTGEMFTYLNDCLEKLVGKQSIIDTREQKKSIGVILELRGEKRKIDIVPYKITAAKGNKTSGYLYVNDPSNPTYTKTDVHALKNFKLTETQKKIVVALKHWKQKYNLPLSSHLLQNFVKDAYERNVVPRKFTHKIMMVLGHIRDNMDVAVIRSIENTNNVLTDISDGKKAEIVAACKKAIEEYEYQPNSVIETFGIE
ncbi:MAG TPA: hypothetical protein VGF30_12340 [Bacteroidia bacterium]